MHRRDSKKLVLAALRTHGPMSDPQLAWWMSHFDISESVTRRARRQLKQAGLVQWARRAQENERGQLLHVWEAKPAKVARN